MQCQPADGFGQKAGDVGENGAGKWGGKMGRKNRAGLTGKTESQQQNHVRLSSPATSSRL